MNLEGKWSSTVIQSDRWPEPIVLKLVEDYGEYVQIVGGQNSEPLRRSKRRN